MFYLLLVFLLQSVLNSEQQSSNVTNTEEISKNESVPEDNERTTVMMDLQRIIQPLEIMQKSSEQEIVLPDNRTVTESSFENFKPSPHLGSFYEHNTFPVKPAYPESKTFTNYFPDWKNIPSWTEQKQSIQNPHDYNVWTENPKEIQWKSTITATPSWNANRVKFPSTLQAPYQFDHPITERFAFNKPVPTSSGTYPKSFPSFWDRLMGFTEGTSHSHSKTFQEYNLLETPPIPQDYYGFQGPKGHGLGYHDSHVGYGATPWKKIVKTLATIIPIGLLLSALTPTVITVTSSNDTSQSRYRLEDSSRGASSSHRLNEDVCEDRILCELLVSASFSKNAESHIGNLLDNFVNRKDITEKKEELLKIFEAVKKQDCSMIICENIRNPT